MITRRKGLFGRGIFFVAAGGAVPLVYLAVVRGDPKEMTSEARHEFPSGTGSTASGGMPIAKMRSRAADRKKSTARE
jgi:hypothetical protein